MKLEVPVLNFSKISCSSNFWHEPMWKMFFPVIHILKYGRSEVFRAGKINNLKDFHQWYGVLYCYVHYSIYDPAAFQIHPTLICRHRSVFGTLCIPYMIEYRWWDQCPNRFRHLDSWLPSRYGPRFSDGKSQNLIWILFSWRIFQKIDHELLIIKNLI